MEGPLLTLHFRRMIKGGGGILFCACCEGERVEPCLFGSGRHAAIAESI